MSVLATLVGLTNTPGVGGVRLGPVGHVVQVAAVAHVAPGIPGVSCPSSAVAIGSAGLGTVCQVGSAAGGTGAVGGAAGAAGASGAAGAAGGAAGAVGGAVSGAAGAVGGAVSGAVGGIAGGVTGLAGSALSSVAGFGVDSVLNALGSWVSSGATWLLSQIGGALSATTSVDLGASWFTAHYGTMAALAGVVIVPLLLLGIIQSVYRQDASALVRSVVVNVPLAVLLTAVAVKLVQLGLALTDAMSNAVASGAGLDAGHFMGSVSLALSGAALVDPTAPAFIIFIGSLVVVLGAVLVWIELLIRAAAVYVAVLFLPLALASLAWPTIAHWCRRLVDTLVALILGKFVIVAVLSLAAGALSGAGGTNGGGFTAVLGGAALLLLAAFAPWALFRLLPFVEAGAVGHLEGLSQRARHSAMVPSRGLAQVAMRASGVGAAAGAAGGLLGGALAGGRGGGTGAAGGPAGSLVGGRGGGPWSGGGTGPSGAEPGGADPGPEGPSGAAPDMGPSSAEATGVGTTSPPGHGIPMYPVHGPASAVAARMRMKADEEDARRGVGSGSGSGPGSIGSGSGSGPGQGPGWASGSTVDSAVLRQLPVQSGTTYPDYLGRDHLGPTLIAARQPPAHRPPPDPSDG